MHSKLVQVDYSNEHQDCDIEPQDKQPDGEQLKSQSGEKSDGNESGLQDNDESELQDGDVSLQGGDVLLQDGDMSLQDDDVSLQDDDLSLQDGDLSLQDGNESGMQGGGLAGKEHDCDYVRSVCRQGYHIIEPLNFIYNPGRNLFSLHGVYSTLQLVCCGYYHFR